MAKTMGRMDGKEQVFCVDCGKNHSFSKKMSKMTIICSNPGPVDFDANLITCPHCGAQSLDEADLEHAGASFDKAYVEHNKTHKAKKMLA